MPRRALLGTWIALASALAGSACFGGIDHSPLTVLPASRAEFIKATSYQLHARLDFTAGNRNVWEEIDAAYQNDAVVYSHYQFGGGLSDAFAVTEILYAPPDLYARTSDGWFVLSPWSQGSEVQVDPNEPVVNYYALSRLMRGTKQLSGTEIDGEKYLRYAAEIDAADLPFLPDASSAPGSVPDLTGRAELWVHQSGYLPYKIQIVAGEGLDSISAAYEFSHYNEPATAPATPADARPWRDFTLPDAPCTGAALVGCLQAQTQLETIATSSCGASAKQLCLVPLGQVSPALVQHLVAYYGQQYGLDVAVLTPQPVPAEIADPLRDQIDASALSDYMEGLFPAAADNPQAVMIGLTPVDLYPEDKTDFRYIFGVKGTPNYPKAVVSTFRMDPRTYGETPNDGLLFSRARKMVSKYVGLMYYGLQPSSDPTSPLFDSIGGVADLDAMQEPLPIGP